MDRTRAPTIQGIHPKYTDDQLKQAEENLDRYLELVLRIYERIRRDPEAYADFRTLTRSGTYANLYPPKVDVPSKDKPSKQR